MPHQPAPRSLVAALATGSALIVALAVAEDIEPAWRWPIRLAAGIVLAILLAIVNAHNGRPEPVGQERD